MWKKKPHTLHSWALQQLISFNWGWDICIIQMHALDQQGWNMTCNFKQHFSSVSVQAETGQSLMPRLSHSAFLCEIVFVFLFFWNIHFFFLRVTVPFVPLRPPLQLLHTSRARWGRDCGCPAACMMWLTAASAVAAPPSATPWGASQIPLCQMEEGSPAEAGRAMVQWHN